MIFVEMKCTDVHAFSLGCRTRLPETTAGAFLVEYHMTLRFGFAANAGANAWTAPTASSSLSPRTSAVMRSRTPPILNTEA